MAWMINAVSWANLPEPQSAPPHRRVEDGPLCGLLTPADGLAGGLTPAQDRIDDPLAEALRHHDALVGAYAREQDVLPMRFGTCVDRPVDAQAVLSLHKTAFSKALTALAGRREITVCAVRSAPLPDEVPPTHGGRSYLAARLAARREADEAAQRINHFLYQAEVTLDPFGPRKRLDPRPDATLRLAAWTCLISLERIDEVAAAIDALNVDAHALGLAVTMSGPHAPFAFATFGTESEEAPQ